MRTAAVILVAALAAPSAAGTYNTTPVQTAATEGLQCMISNVGTAPVTVTAVLLDVTGAAITPVGDVCQSGFGGELPAGATCGVVYAGSTFARCTVTASSSRIRAALSVVDNTGRMTLSVPATKK
jgi:hypothetical protein